MSRNRANVVPVITIDGPGGSGKGTIAMRLAQDLGWHFLDSGALYRLVAVAALDRGLPEDDEQAIAELAAGLDVAFGMNPEGIVILLDGNRISGRLRSEEVSALASRVAAIPQVRAALTERQKAFRQEPGLVADGRDMGTVIFPDAAVKIFLTASVQERARRRYKQLKDKGENVTFSRLFREIEKRDERDRSRSVAPLRPADDAVIIDSTELSVNQVLAKIHKILEDNNITT